MRTARSIIQVAFLAALMCPAWTSGNEVTVYTPGCNCSSELRNLHEEIAKLKADQEQQRALIKILLDANPDVKAKLAQKIKEDKEKREADEQAARDAEAAEQKAATTIAHITKDGFHIQTENGCIYDVTSNAGGVSSWPDGTQFDLGIVRFQTDSSGRKMDQLQGSSIIPIGRNGTIAATIRFNAELTEFNAHIAKAKDGDELATKVLKEKMNFKVRRLVDGTFWRATDSSKQGK